MSEQLVWVCDGCGFPVSDDAGSIHVDVREALDACAKDRGESGAVSVGDFLNLPRPARWEVHHSKCEPDPERSDYWIGVEQARSHAQLLGWTAHLMDKTWLGDTTWASLIRAAAKVDA